MTSKKFINRKWLIAALGTLLVILVLTHLPQSAVVRQLNITSFDKILHTLGYGIFGYMLLCAIRLRSRIVSFLIVLGLIAVIGALDESTQPLVQRSASIADWLANCVGVCIAAFCSLCCKVLKAGI